MLILLTFLKAIILLQAVSSLPDFVAELLQEYKILNDGTKLPKIGFGTYGARALFEEISKRVIESTGDPRAGSYLGQRISLAIQRGNAASILGTMPRCDGFDESPATIKSSSYAPVENAIKAGYKFIDTAYENAKALTGVLRRGVVKIEDIFVSKKLDTALHTSSSNEESKALFRG